MARANSWSSSALARWRSSSGFFRARRTLFRSRPTASPVLGRRFLFLAGKQLVHLLVHRPFDRGPERLEQEPEVHDEMQALLVDRERARHARAAEGEDA